MNDSGPTPIKHHSPIYTPRTKGNTQQTGINRPKSGDEQTRRYAKTAFSSMKGSDSESQERGGTTPLKSTKKTEGSRTVKKAIGLQPAAVGTSPSANSSAGSWKWISGDEIPVDLEAKNRPRLIYHGKLLSIRDYSSFTNRTHSTDDSLTVKQPPRVKEVYQMSEFELREEAKKYGISTKVYPERGWDGKFSEEAEPREMTFRELRKAVKQKREIRESASKYGLDPTWCSFDQLKDAERAAERAEYNRRMASRDDRRAKSERYHARARNIKAETEKLISQHDSLRAAGKQPSYKQCLAARNATYTPKQDNYYDLWV